MDEHLADDHGTLNRGDRASLDVFTGNCGAERRILLYEIFENDLMM